MLIAPQLARRGQFLTFQNYTASVDGYSSSAQPVQSESLHSSSLANPSFGDNKKLQFNDAGWPTVATVIPFKLPVHKSKPSTGINSQQAGIQSSSTAPINDQNGRVIVTGPSHGSQPTIPPMPLTDHAQLPTLKIGAPYEQYLQSVTASNVPLQRSGQISRYTNDKTAFPIPTRRFQSELNKNGSDVQRKPLLAKPGLSQMINPPKDSIVNGSLTNNSAFKQQQQQIPTGSTNASEPEVTHIFKEPSKLPPVGPGAESNVTGPAKHLVANNSLPMAINSSILTKSNSTGAVYSFNLTLGAANESLFRSPGFLVQPNIKATTINQSDPSWPGNCSGTVTQNFWKTVWVTSTVTVDEIVTLGFNKTLPTPYLNVPLPPCVTVSQTCSGDCRHIFLYPTTVSSTLLVTKKQPAIVPGGQQVGRLFAAPAAITAVNNQLPDVPAAQITPASPSDTPPKGGPKPQDVQPSPARPSITDQVPGDSALQPQPPAPNEPSPAGNSGQGGQQPGIAGSGQISVPSGSTSSDHSGGAGNIQQAQVPNQQQPQGGQPPPNSPGTSQLFPIHPPSGQQSQGQPGPQQQSTAQIYPGQQNSGQQSSGQQSAGQQNSGQNFAAGLFDNQPPVTPPSGQQSSGQFQAAPGSQNSNNDNLSPPVLENGSGHVTMSNGRPQGPNDIIPLGNTAPVKSAILGNLPVVLNAHNIVIGSQTFAHGPSPSSAIVGGETFSWDAVNLMAHSTVMSFPTPEAKGPVVNMAGQDFTVHPTYIEVGGSTFARPYGSKASPFALNGKTFLLTPSKIISPDKNIPLPQGHTPIPFVYNGQILSADSSYLYAGSTSLPLASSDIVTYQGQRLTVRPSEIIGPSTTVALPQTPQIDMPNTPTTISTDGHVVTLGPSAAVIGSKTFSFLPGIAPQTFEDHGQNVTVGPQGVNFGAVTIPVPSNTPHYSVIIQNHVTFSVAPSEAIVGGLHVLNVQPGMVPITTIVDGQTVNIGAKGVGFAATTIPLPTPQPSFSITEEGGLTFSVAPSEAVIDGSTYHIMPNSPSTTKIIDGQTIEIGPSGIQVKGSTVNLPSVENGLSNIQATADGISFSVGATNAVVGGTTYPVGFGASAQTVIVGSETIKLGTEGVVFPAATLGMGLVLPGTTITPGQTPTPVIAGDVSLAADATEAVINGTTYTIGSGSPATTISAGKEAIRLGTGGIILPSTTIKPWLVPGSSGFSSIPSLTSTAEVTGSTVPFSTGRNQGNAAEARSRLPTAFLVGINFCTFMIGLLVL